MEGITKNCGRWFNMEAVTFLQIASFDTRFENVINQTFRVMSHTY